jgi:hypothetical protein
MGRYFIFVVVLLLAACTRQLLPFEKETVSSSDLVRPPWETLVKAGPGADKDIDYETLDGPDAQLTNAPTPPGAVEEPDVPQQAEEAPPPEKASVGKKSKKVVAIKSVAVPRVSGAKGKGNAELTKAMRDVLRESGWPVLEGPREDAVVIRGKVTLGAVKGDLQNVKIKWSVATADGQKLGDVDQSNDVPAGSLDSSWGENARYASEAAAEGIFKLIQGYR